MEESSYVPNSIPPSLVVFSQSGYGDAIRMQRPFGSQVSDGKESLSLQNLSTSSFGLRPMESFGGLPAQLVHLQNPFLHPALEGRLPFGSAGAFRPILTSGTHTHTHSTPTSTSGGGGGSSSNVHGMVDGARSHGDMKILPSAFTAPTPANRRKLDSIVESVREQQSVSVYSSSVSSGAMNLDKNSSGSSYVNGQGKQQLQHQKQQHHQQLTSSQRHLSISPVNSSPSKDERDRGDDCYGDERDENLTPNSDLTDRSTPEDSHLSKRRRKDGLGCPVCKMSLRPMELESHLLSEVEQLMCMSRLRRQGRDEPSTSSRDSPGASNSKKDSTTAEVSQDSRWEAYHRVRANRHSRLRLKTRRRREESGGGPHVSCPVCQVPLQGSNEQFSAHVEACLRKNGDMLDEDEPVDIEGDGDGHEMDGYPWLGHRRGRSSPSGYSGTALNMTTNSRRRDEENDTLEVVVDGDDTSTFGNPQYTESDIQSSMSISTASSHLDANNSQHDIKLSNWGEEETNGEDLSSQTGTSVNHGIVMQALKNRIRELENKLKCGIPHDGNHCLICMDKYKKPVVSISCWHVHCEECWLKTLGTKKLCPQCNMITSASDLRRIFL